MAGITLNLDMAGAAALLVGGGVVATRKAVVLRKAGMQLTVVAPQVSDRLAQWAADGALTWLQREYRTGDLVGAALVVAATGQRQVNRQVAADARAAGLWINVADAPAEGNCRFPALLQRGGLEVAVSTAGASPAVSAAVRDMLADTLDESYSQALELLAAVREKLLTLGQADTYNAKLIKELLAEGLVDLLRQGQQASAIDLIKRKCAEQGITISL